MDGVVNDTALIQNGINIGDKFNTYLSDQIDVLKEVVINWLCSMSDKVLALIAIVAVAYIVYQSLRVMFFGKPEFTQKALFGYFFLLVIRILNTIVSLKV